MSHNTQSFRFLRGERTDLHIAALRKNAEDTFGQTFADAVELRHKLDDPGFGDDDYDNAVIGFICSTVLRIKPLPAYLRGGLGILLGLVPAKRSELVTVPVVGRRSSLQARSDRAAVELVIQGITAVLYPARSYLGGLTDLGCGLEGLRLTWRKDILSEADASGIISVDGLRRIRSKLSKAIAESGAVVGPILLDGKGKAIKPADEEWTRRSLERRYKLIELIEHAVSVGSPIQCIPSRIREERIAEAYRREPQKLAS